METNKFYDLIRSHKFLAQKELGQNYLISNDTCKSIVDELLIHQGEKIIEIGCGLGSLSYHLVKYENLSKLEMIDIDDNSLNFCKENINTNYEFLNKNAVKTDYSNFDKVIGNLPYYITSSILEKVLLDSKDIKKAVFMVQKEAFERISSKIGTEDYGPLPILISYCGTMKDCFKVSRHDFSPEPHVDSVVFSIEFKKRESIETILYKLTKICFIHRRKTIFNNLKSHFKDVELVKKVLNKCKIEENLRPEQISLESYVLLSKELKQFL